MSVLLAFVCKRYIATRSLLKLIVAGLLLIAVATMLLVRVVAPVVVVVVVLKSSFAVFASATVVVWSIVHWRSSVL